MASNFLDEWRQRGRKINHSGFDVGCNRIFNVPTGLIQPVLFKETNPNERFQLDISGLIRSQRLNTAAFCSGRFIVDAFFVPYSQIWHNFNSFVIQKDDRHSSTQKGMVYVPSISLSELLSWIYDHICLCITQGSDGLTHFDYDQAIEQGLVDMHKIPVMFNMLRMLQWCKYGNYFWIYDDLIGLTQQQFIDKQVVISNFLEALHSNDKFVNIFRPAAYQHIFYDYYRNKYFDDSPWFQSESDQDQSLRYIDIFNFDDIECSNFATSVLPLDSDFLPKDSISTARVVNLFNLNYHQYKSDIYTAAMASTQFGAVSGVTLDPITFDVNSDGVVVARASDNTVRSADDSVTYNGDTIISPSGSIVGKSSSAISANPSFFDVLQLRRAELMQQWKMNALRAGNMVDPNFSQHYGVEPYYEGDNNVRFLGEWSANFDVNAVVAQAATGDEINGQVGDIAAIGTGSMHGDKVTFECKDFGVIVCCAYFLPDVYYSANGIDKENTLVEPFDFYSEEFENIGFEPLMWFQQSAGVIHTNDFVMGYVPPYSQYKTAVDETFGSFSHIIYGVDQSVGQYTTWYGSMLPWTMFRQDIPAAFVNGVAVRSKSAYYVAPSVSDTLFGINYNGTIDTDPFSFALHFNVGVLRPMSVLGLPIFG